ncbi:hypothetical protein SPRG_05616 [Saprolegnia parasitica CBS 223.65]|uniref:Methyltransferase type 12 domain-containing protein n=1 Tax=Saprolegnia parasitica (strain CBS 223.65) TaxID=695850 RepID=A0A067CFZ6_SAPPC|nr:hypothetical protein SPRG_05616 [Saprolegnia parasitica CBS 223.65]KDO29664.1 hypothetical protein SPRG_05616 [Saprolegnia parasitica CBS 223.65]|eukprot:XP_012199722.1 hypothetical protein SPRG_05616 [Saprolegnia parasitica CBS 223.65]
MHRLHCLHRRVFSMSTARHGEHSDLVGLTAHLLKQAVMPLVTSKGTASPLTLRVLDAGAGNGGQSMQLLSTLLTQCEQLLPWETHREYLVLHASSSANDVTALVDALASDPSYVNSHHNAFAGQLVPHNSVDVCVSYAALQWLSTLPSPVPGPMLTPDNVSGDVTWQAAATADLTEFLTLRAAEVADNGVLSMTLMADVGASTVGLMVSAVESALTDLVALDLLSPTSLDKIAIGWYLRSMDDVATAASVVVDKWDRIELRAISLPVKMPTATAMAMAMLSLLGPTLAAGMTEHERSNPELESALVERLAARFAEPVCVRDKTAPLYAVMTIDYIYAAFARRHRTSLSI